MALYQNGTLISGANTLPQMTLAEYQALPVSERPTYWERTDLNYSNIPASDVTYGSGSVEDALDMKQVSKIYDVSSSTFTTLVYFGNTAYLGSVVPETSLYGKVASFSARTTSQYPCVCSMASNGNINFISSVNADVQVRIVYDGRLTTV